MQWYFSPIVYFLVVCWVVGIYHISNWNTGNEGGFILKFVAFAIGFGLSSFLWSLDYFVRTRLWDKRIMIGTEVFLILVLILIFTFWTNGKKLF